MFNMILHLADDNRFMNHVINMFELASPNENIYFIHVLDPSKELIHINKSENIIVSNSEDEYYLTMINDLGKYDAVILHNIINKYKYDILRNSNSDIHFHWMSWGADIYCNPRLKYIYSSNSDKNLKGRIGDFFNDFFPNLWYKYYLQKKNIELDCLNRSLAKKIKSISTVVPTENKIIEKYFNIRAKFILFKYASIEQLLSDNINEIVSGDNILVGNSATSPNNHIEAFKVLKSINYNHNIYIPLSYGDNNYRDRIINVSKTFFGKQAFPLINYLPLVEYTKIIRSCGNVIMNHKRQQAMGNIIATLWLGARVFFNTASPIYLYFKTIGIIVFELNELKDLSSLPSYEDMASINRPILYNLYSNEKVLEETKELVKYLKE